MKFLDLRWRDVAIPLANGIILILWFWLFRPVYAYLGTIFTRQEFRTNQIVLFAVLALMIMQIRRGRLRLPFDSLPALHLPGIILAICGAIAFVIVEHWLDINTLSATLFGLATYGLLGLWMDSRSWRRSLPAALLLVGALPFGEHMETFVGYPLRLATARVVSHGSAALGFPNLGVDTILIFENGLSQVDSPCSGVKSLWTGGLFFLAATWIERRAINRRWLLAAFVFGCLLLAANLARVALLVLVGQAVGWHLLAEMLHVPLGIIGFIVACLAALGMLRWVGEALTEIPVQALPAARPRWLAPALAAVLISLVVVYAPPPHPAAAAALTWNFPAELTVQDWPLDSIEMGWISDDGSIPLSAARWRFEWRGLSGSMIFIASDTWRAHHRPERCFNVYGLDTLDSRVQILGVDFPLRWLTLGHRGEALPLATAAYWLQSNRRITDDYSVRMWDDLAPRPETWILVTILFDAPVNPGSVDTQGLFQIIRQSVQDSLAGQ